MADAKLRRTFSADFAGKQRSVRSETVTPKARKFRLLLICFFCCLWTVALVVRLFSLQISDVETWQDWALKQHFAEVQIASERGPVLDRNDKLMAVSVPAGSIYARPRQISDKVAAAKLLAAALDMKVEQVREKLQSPEPFVWIKRQIPRFNSDRIMNLKLAGVGTVMEAKRFYPYNQAASALIGKVGIDGKGLSGIEDLYETRLHVDHVTTRVNKDAFGKIIQDADTSETDEGFNVPKGDALKLTLDADLQIIMDEELEAGKVAANAKQAMGVMLDAETGEIVALSQSPSFNFNSPESNNKKALHNLLVEAVFEPGSTMKPLVTAAALEEKVVRTTDMIDCENGHYFFATHTIKDAHPSGVISVRDVVIRSSNIGMTKIGVRLGAGRLYEYLRRFGFGSSTHLGLAGESGGILRPVSTWAKIDVATHSFGQGVAVTPLQIVRAMSAIANGGVLPNLTVVADGNNGVGKRVLSAKTADQVRDILYGVVEDEHGTGHQARIDGLKVGGKTGTAQKAVDHGRGYRSGAYVASFVGFVDGTPYGVPKILTTMVIIDEPHAGSIYGGAVAAPVWKKIVDRSLRFLATKNTLSPNESTIIPPSVASDPYKAGLTPARLDLSNDAR